MSEENKKTINSQKHDLFTRKASPANRKLNKTQSYAESNHDRRTEEIGKNQPKLEKRPTFFKFIPSTSKNFVTEPHETDKHSYYNIKEVKVPTFFKKGSNRPLISEGSEELVQTPVHFLRKRQRSTVVEKENEFQVKFRSLENSAAISLQSRHKPLSESTQNRVQLQQYKKLNDKINYLQSKIFGMKEALDKKREQKLSFLETERTERSSVLLTDGESSTCSSSDAPLKKFITQVPQHKQFRPFKSNPYSPRNSKYYLTEVLRAYRQQKSLVREHLTCSIEYLKLFEFHQRPSEQQISHLKVNLPTKKGYENKKTIIFDLDETLIHCNENIFMKHDIKLQVRFPTGELIQVGVNIRPYAKEILSNLSQKFEIVVFTASHSCYANEVLNMLDPEKKYIQHRLFREHCIMTKEGVYVKDLRVIVNRSLSKMVLVDNAAYSYAYQVDNGVPIIPYYEGQNDYELYALQKYLESLISTSDVRQVNRKTFQLCQYVKFDSVDTLVNQLYSDSVK